MPKYGELTMGQIEALVNRLGGMKSVHSILKGESTVKVMPAEKVAQPVPYHGGERCRCGGMIHRTGQQTRCTGCGVIRCGY